jgi:D-apiose dehydrogenase
VKVALAGLGFFSRFHADAWRRTAGAELVGGADPDASARSSFAQAFPGIPLHSAVEELLEVAKPDVLDVVTRPELHAEVARTAFRRRVNVICQKPLAPDLEVSRRLVEEAKDAGVRLLVHDNWSFQPWWVAVREAIERGELGRVFFARFSVRAGDGRGPSPFPKQPYFRAMPRFFFYETAIHQLDLARALLGEVETVRALAGRVRDDVAGEDLGVALLRMDSGALVVIEGNRWSEAPERNEAFGESVVEGTLARVRVEASGRALLEPLGAAPRTLYDPGAMPGTGYRGDSVGATVGHLLRALESGEESRLEGRRYLATMEAVFAIYSELEKEER